MADLPKSLELRAVLDPSPCYRGTSHDDETARAMGYRAALIPGAFVYGHATRLAVQGWGMDWLSRGRAEVRFRRPVYNGDPLRIERGELREDADGPVADVTVTQMETGEVVLDGTFGLVREVPVMPSEFSVLSLPEHPVALVAGSVPVDVPLGSARTVLTREMVRQSLADFCETEAIYAERDVIHSGMLLRRSMSDCLANFVLPMPVIFAAARVQNLGVAPVGATYATGSRVTRVWEKRGRHFFDSEEWLIAEGIGAVARHVRTNLYAVSE